MADLEALTNTIASAVPRLSYPIAVDEYGDPLDPTTILQIRLPRAGEPSTSDSIFSAQGGRDEQLHSVTVQEQLELLYQQGFRGRAVFTLHGQHRLAEGERQNAASRSAKYPPTDCSICTAFINGKERMKGYMLLELRNAGQAGCSACSALYQAVTHFAKILGLEYEDWESAVQQKSIDSSKLLSKSREISVDFIQNDENVTHLNFNCTGRLISPIDPDVLSPRIIDTSSNSTVKLVRVWLDKCMMEHQKCNIRAQTLLPSRLIDVSNHRVRLVETEGKRGSYLALSHCWGRSEIVRTKRANYPERMRDIPWELLSKTFQDAIMFTWKLGYRYIWIDSLCIIQDDEKDWEIQASQMARIFSRAQLTISATHARGGSEGCFSVRTEEPFRYAYRGKSMERRNIPAIWANFNISARDRDGITKSLDIRVKPQHGVQHNPLLRRAWVFQEQILSPRILHFASGELYWECKSYVCCECLGWEKRQESLQMETRRRKAYSQLVELKPSLRQPSFESQEQQMKRNFDAYRSLIEEYTDTHITQELDRLPALSGISFGRQDEYLAGMWRSMLVMCLHWMSSRSEGHAMASRPFKYRAPTWSWAAIEAPVKHIGEFSSRYYTGIYGTSEPVAAVIVASCTPQGIDARGRVASGYLKIQGQVVRCKATAVRVRDNPGYHESDTCAELRLRTLVSECELDHPISLARQPPSEVLPGQELALLRISTRVALVLEDVADVPGAYRRVGIFWVKEAEKWFTGSSKVFIFIL